MRKMSERQKRMLIRRSRQVSRQRNRAGLRKSVVLAARLDFQKWRGHLPSIVISPDAIPGYACFDPPSEFSLYSNFEQTLAFLLDFREVAASARRLVYKRRRIPFYANFSVIRDIDSASGLVLAAEVDRWVRMCNGHPQSFDHLWPENVRDFFHDNGLFSLLRIDPQSTRSTTPTGGRVRPLKYETGVSVDGETANALREKLEALCGRVIGPRKKIYDALIEAMTNVGHHAYPLDIRQWPTAPRGRWWLGGSWRPDEKIVTVQMYDQGVGIAKTLPRAKHWSEVLPILGRIDRERTDAGMIEAAMDYGRTSTGKEGRGKGLAQMAEWIQQTGRGSLRIMSGRGSLTYLPGNRPIRMSLPVSFGGTLVEWEVQFDD